MRIRIIQKPNIPSVDGVRLAGFEWGRLYDVNSALGLLMIAQDWATPVMPEELRQFSDFDADAQREPDTPVNFRREIFPPYYDDAPPAVALDRRRRPRKWS